MAQVVTITLNTAYDLVGSLEKVHLGEVNTAQTLGIYPAGKGVNVAKVLVDLGINTIVSGFLGENNQTDFQTLFRQLKCEDKFHRVVGNTRINVKITESNMGEVTDINFSGYKVGTTDWDKFVQDSMVFCRNADIVAVCGSLPDGVTPTAFKDWLMQLKKNNLNVVLDTSNEALKFGLQASPWLVKPNHKELSAWIGYELTSLPQIIDAAKKLKSLGIEHVIVSMGTEGAVWINDDSAIHAQPPKCNHVVSTVGAGDSMVAGLIYGLINKLSSQQTLKLASALSAFSVSQSNVGIADKRVLDDILTQVKITLIEDELC